MNVIPVAGQYVHTHTIMASGAPALVPAPVTTPHLQLAVARGRGKGVQGQSSSSRDDDERKHIRELSKRLPGLTNIFNLHHKIGEGSFSSVFLASLKHHEHLPREQRKLFAIKHLVPTSHPSRIEQELRCLKYIGGCDNVVGLDFCMRKYDTVIFVMPYLPHTKFSEYVLKMDVQETKHYLKNLLLALRRVHQFNIIHRDVKPSNFLYDRINKRFLLVDFGLAQKMDSWPTSNLPRGQSVVSLNSNMNSTNPSNSATYSLPLDSNIVSTDQQKHDRKRKYVQVVDPYGTQSDLEPIAKRPQLQPPSQNAAGVDCTPLKPLQEDHPKITPAMDATPPVQRSQAVAPKLNTVKRQVFVDDENGTKNDLNPCNKRLDNVHNYLPISVQNYTTNISFNNSYNNNPYAVNSYYCNPTLQNPYQNTNAPIDGSSSALDLHKLAQYYNSYYSYNNMLANNIYAADKSNMQHYKANIEYQFHKNQWMQNSINNYNKWYVLNSKLSLMDVGNAPRQVQQNVTVLPNAASKTRNNNTNLLNNSKAEKVDVSKQVSVKHEALKKDGSVNSSSVKLCGCGGKPSVCSICLGRGAYNAPRAGTQGFRPPEVLLKYTEQTTAVDLWACGVILLSIVSGCYPFFRAPDDLTALAEMVTLFGSKPLKEVATILGRHLMCSHVKKPLDLRKLCSHLRYGALKTNSAGSSDLVKSTIDHMQDAACQNNTFHKTDYTNTTNDKKTLVADQCQILNNNSNLHPSNCRNATSNNNRYSANFKNARKSKKNCSGCFLPVDSCVCASEESQKNNCIDKASRTWCGFPDIAFDLLERLLDLNPHTRITAVEALQHPFLADL